MTRYGVWRGGLGAALLLLLAAPPRPAGAGAWVLPARRFWAQVSAFGQETTERYFLDGRRTPYFFEGRNRTMALFGDVRYGLSDRLEVGAQLGVYRLRFDDLSDRRRSTGLGDLRVAARWNVAKGSTVATVGAVLKFPTGEFVNDAEVVPVGEGQYDVDLTVEAGHSFWPRRAYLTVTAGYRVRGTNRKNGISPGDEVLWAVEGGHHLVSRLSLKGLVRGLHGLRSTSFGLEIPSLKREVVYVQPGLVWELAADRGIDVSLPFTVRGRNWPAGLSVGVGFYSRF
jgi:hypothetical protein